MTFVIFLCQKIWKSQIKILSLQRLLIKTRESKSTLNNDIIMNKEQKEEIKKVLSIIEDAKLLKFTKAYAMKDEAFAKAVIEHFMPEDKPIDYEKEIEECFKHKKKGRIAYMEPSLDWVVIRKESKRVMKQLQFMYDAEDYASVANGALLFLDTLSESFYGDNLEYDHTWYEGKDFSNNKAEELLRKILTSDKNGLSKSEKLKFVDRLKTIRNRDIIDNYLGGGLSQLIVHAENLLLDDEQLLAKLDKLIEGAVIGHFKGAFIVKKIELLKKMGRADEAERIFKDNMQNEVVREYHLKSLIDDHKYEDAIALCKKYISENSYNHETWEVYRLKIAELADMKYQKVEALTWLAGNANAEPQERKSYCEQLKAVCDSGHWVRVRDNIIKSVLESNSWDKSLAIWLLIEDKLIDRLFKYISELPTSDYYASGEILFYYSAFPDVFNEAQQDELENLIITQIRSYSRRANDSGHYKKIAEALLKLAETRPAAAAKAKSLRTELFVQYPRKTALLSALRSVDL